MDALRIWVRDLFSKDYENCDDRVSEDEMKKEDHERLARYNAIIMGGMSSFLLKDSITMLDRVYGMHVIASYFLTFYVAFAVLSMVLGLIACKFPTLAPHHMGTDGHGAFQGLIFLLVGVHLDTFIYYPCLICPLISLVMAILVVTIYWGYSVQDPVLLHAIAKLLVWMAWWVCGTVKKAMKFLWKILCRAGCAVKKAMKFLWKILCCGVCRQEGNEISVEDSLLRGVCRPSASQG